MTRGHWILFLSLSAAVVCLGLTSQGHVQVFNSPLTMKVFARLAVDVPDRVLGFTPVAKGHRIRINPGTFWYVRPGGNLNARKLDRLARDIHQFGIPGLDLSDHWELTDASLHHLRGLSSLRFLDLSRTRLTNACASSLATLPNLAILSTPESFNDHGVASLSKLKHLRDLSLDRTHVTDEGLRELMVHPGLEALDLSETAVTDHGLAFLKGLPNLHRLVLNGRITDAGTPALQALTSLRHIDISQTQITDSGLAALAALPNLHSVYLNRSIGDRGLDRLSASRSLVSLDLSGAPISNAGMESLAKIQTLQELDVSQTHLDDAGLAALAKLPNLRMLEISDTHVTGAGLAPLARLRHLEILSLSYQKLTRDDLRAMARLAQVKTIVLNGVPLPEATMDELRHINHVSPWDHPVGLAEAGFQPKSTPPVIALGSPVSTSKAMQPSVELPGSAHELTSPLVHFHPAPTGVNGKSATVSLPAATTASAVVTAKAPRSKPSAVDALQSVPAPKPVESQATVMSDDTQGRRALKDKSGHYLLGGPIAGRASGPEDIVVPEARTAKGAPSEDALLSTISKQSSRSLHGGYSGLAGMRQLKLAQNPAVLGDMDNGAQAHIPMQDDTAANSVGEIDVGVGGRR